MFLFKKKKNVNNFSHKLKSVMTDMMTDVTNQSKAFRICLLRFVTVYLCEKMCIFLQKDKLYQLKSRHFTARFCLCVSVSKIKPLGGAKVGKFHILHIKQSQYQCLKTYRDI